MNFIELFFKIKFFLGEGNNHSEEETYQVLVNRLGMSLSMARINDSKQQLVRISETLHQAE